jgi:hypothetical protein
MCKVAPGGENKVTITNVSRQILPGNPYRTALVIPCPVTNRVTLSTFDPVVADQGFVLPVGGHPIKLCGHTAGSFVQRAIFGITSAGSETLSFIEVFEEPGVKYGNSSEE